MILVYCNHITPRIQYIFRIILDALCGFDYRLTSNASEYKNYNGPTLNYSALSLRMGDIEIRPNGFLELQEICECTARIVVSPTDVQLFLHAARVESNNFDLFAASFYLISRYEEYLPFVPDKHNRFEAHSSLLFEQSLLYRPLVNEWAAILKQTISKNHTRLPFRKNKFTYTLTIDIDQAFAFANRGAFKNALSFSKNLLSRNTAFIRSQLQTFLLNKKDSYDTFGYLKELQHRYALNTIYFVNVGSPTSFDKNLSLNNKAFQNLIRQLTTYAAVGVHPSYYANRSTQKLQTEKEELEFVSNGPLTKSRQHYLKIAFPQTYKHLLKIGITEDYSMGYASHPGFRAGICSPFHWFDLESNKETSLIIYPITYMEGSFAEDLKMPPEVALEEIKKLTDTVKKFNGHHISIWHNHTVNDLFFWQGWKTVFEESLYYMIYG